jgi:hypothetical protein
LLSNDWIAFGYRPSSSFFLYTLFSFVDMSIYRKFELFLLAWLIDEKIKKIREQNLERERLFKVCDHGAWRIQECALVFRKLYCAIGWWRVAQIKQEEEEAARVAAQAHVRKPRPPAAPHHPPTAPHPPPSTRKESSYAVCQYTHMTIYFLFALLLLLARDSCYIRMWRHFQQKREENIRKEAEHQKVTLHATPITSHYIISNPNTFSCAADDRGVGGGQPWQT